MSATGALEIGGARLLIRPNRSLPVAGMAALFVAFGIHATVVGVWFTLAGAWMVLPFAGIEIAIVGALCLWFYRHRDDCELVTIEADRVRVMRRRGNATASYDFPRYWVRVALDRRPGNGVGRLRIGSHGRHVTLGEEISDSDRAQLAQELKRLLASG